MKRIATTLAIAFAAAALLTGASVWEGAAVTAAAGELPETGNHVATNSFPKNTVVEIQNLENDKTVRAIVSAGLDSPGLLASLSRDAAAAIGLSSRDIGRIRMTMPADPIAFSQFNEGFEPSGDPDHDPQAAIAAATVPTDGSEASGPGPSEPEPSEKAEAPEAPMVAEEEGAVDMDATGAGAPPLAVLPEEAAEEPLAEEPLAEEPLAEEPLAEEPLAEEPLAEEVPGGIAEVVTPVDVDQPEVPADGSIAAPEEPIAEALPPAQPPESGTEEFVLVPAEERPAGNAPEKAPPQSAEVAPIGEGSDEAGEPVPLVTLPSDTEAAPIMAQEPPLASEPSPKEALSFGALMITSLEKGKYYLQLGSFGKTESVEAEISKLGNRYPLAIQSTQSKGEKVYRVLVGPVNQGESAALLQRFKRSGYKKAFVWQGS